MNDRDQRTGFTLIELMVVVIIIAALAAMVMPRLMPASDEAKRSISKGDIANLTVALKLYRLHDDRYPRTDENKQWSALLSQPSSAKNWHGPYLDKIPRDPWKQVYQYRYPGTHNTSGFDIWSLGPDDKSSEDDVTNWGE